MSGTDFCLSGCGKRCQMSSLYCSSHCFVKEMHATNMNMTIQKLPFHPPHGYHHLQSNHSTELSGTSISPALSATSSTAPISPLFLASSPPKDTIDMPLFSLSFKNRPQHFNPNQQLSLKSQRASF